LAQQSLLNGGRSCQAQDFNRLPTVVHQNWKDAYDALRARSGSVDSDQLALARQLDLYLGPRVPAIVAAVLIRERLARVLRERPRTELSHKQLEYLSDLVEWLDIRRGPSPVETRQQVSAWIDVLELRRAAKALAAMRPMPGDVIASIDHPDEIGTVVSISDEDGRINVAGPGGRGLRPHDVRFEARAGDHTPAAEDARRVAENRAAIRARTSDMPSQEKIAHLEAHRVSEPVESHDVTGLESVINSAGDERPVQAYIQDRLQLLTALAGPTSLGTYARSKPSLGGLLFPDFVLAVADSAGLHWTLVELESSAVAVGLQNGQLSKEARKGVQQIESWREWLTEHLAMARSSGPNGYGLTDIRPESPGIVLIGRRAAGKTVSSQVQHRLWEEQHITLHSYDWLLDGFRTRGRPGGTLLHSSSLEFL
jgi:hypothetical protein